MRPLLAAILFSSSLGITAQNTYTVCDVQEFCYCWDGQNNGSFTLLACPDSLLNEAYWMSVHFCEGGMAGGDVMRIYSGEDVNGVPVFGLSGSWPSLANTGGSSTGPSMHIEFDWLETPSCQDGDSPPVRFIAWTGVYDPNTISGTCTGTDPFCLTTGLAAPRRQPGLTVRGRELLLPASLAHATRIDLFDASGRGVGGMRPQGRTTLALPSSLGAGVYLAVVESGGIRSSARFVLSE
ncbi:MAG: hypothetical protein WAT74_00790 [Flavobacteriales bacterium]